MEGPEVSQTGPDEARQEAENILNRVFKAWMATAGVFLVIMVVGLFLGPDKPALGQAGGEQDRGDMMKALVVLLFFSATIINIGIRWSAKIIGARRFKRADLRPAARAFAVSQLMCFGVYFLFLATVFYYRITVGRRHVLVIATLAAIMASLYFLNVPRYLLSAVFAPDEAAPGDAEGGEG